MHGPSRALSVHRVVTALLCLPPVVGLGILMVPDHETVGGVAMLSWPLPVIYLAVIRRWSAVSMVAAAMAALSLAGLGSVYLTWVRTGCMYGLVLMGAVFLLGGSAVVASVLGLVSAAVAGRRQRTRGLRVALVANWCLLGVALVTVVPFVVRLLLTWSG